MKRVDARHPNKVWIPRRASTFIGSFNRVMDTLGTAGDVEVLTEIGTTITLGLVKNQSPSQICDSLVKTEGWKSNQFGELGYWSVAIAMGMSNGNSFSESVTDAFDLENIGFWAKIGYGWGYLTAETIIAFEKWMNADEKKALEEKILSNIKKAGYSDEAEKALREWLSLSQEERMITPFKLKDEWKQKGEKKECEKKEDETQILSDFLLDIKVTEEEIEEICNILKLE